MRSLGLATDLLALDGVSTVERHPDRVLLRTPAEPDYWSGNMLISLRPPGAPEAEAARFRVGFPDARHLKVAWDDPALDPEPLRAPWAALGAEVELEDVLARDGPPPPRPLPDGYLVRELATEADWEASVRLALLVGEAMGYDPRSHEGFLRRRAATRRAQVRTGRLRWWGAFRDDALAAQMGLVEGRRLARFQAVETHPDHRRRGLCAALLALVGAAARSPRLVIVAEAGGDAGRLYRRAGFALAETVVSVQRRAY